MWGQTWQPYCFFSLKELIANHGSPLQIFFKNVAIVDVKTLSGAQLFMLKRVFNCIKSNLHKPRIGPESRLKEKERRNLEMTFQRCFLILGKMQMLVIRKMLNKMFVCHICFIVYFVLISVWYIQCIT